MVARVEDPHPPRGVPQFTGEMRRSAVYSFIIRARLQ
jgi:hypothetical protein